MHIIYVDETGDDGFSGSGTYRPNQTPTRYFCRIGLIIHDWKWFKINEKIKKLRFSYNIPNTVELHATEIFQGQSKFYDSRTKRRRSRVNWFGSHYPKKSDRKKILNKLCKLIQKIDVKLICVAIDKTKIDQSHHHFEDLPKKKSWEFLIERINHCLEHSKDKKGMIISDAVQDKIEKQHRDFATALYNRSMHINEKNFIESILFEPSDSSNLLQITDIASYAFGRKYNAEDNFLYEVLSPKINQVNGEINGCGLKVWPE